MIAVAQASAWYAPVSWGGTEVYLSGLVRELRGQGTHSTVVAPLGVQHPHNYDFEGTAVRTFRISSTPNRASSRGNDQQEGLVRFREILAELAPDIYHQHSWTYGVGAPHLRIAKTLGLRTVLTAHVAGVTCLRGTMTRYGTGICDGRIDRFICAACWGQERGAPKPVALALAAMSLKIGSVADRMLPASRLTTALSGSALVDRVRADLDSMVECADRIVAVSQWLYDVFLLNGVPPEKLALSRQGVDSEFVAQIEHALSGRRSGGRDREKFRFLYLGRWQSIKGVDVIVRAIKALPLEMPVELVIHGVGDGYEERAYAAHIEELASGDERITVAPPVSRAALADALLQADALAVPSRILETGPLVVLEAKAAALPILGSRLGGIAELVREPEDGLLVEPDNVEAWTAAIIRMLERRSSVRQPAKIRTMRDVATDMNGLYHQLCAAPARQNEAYSCA